QIAVAISAYPTPKFKNISRDTAPPAKLAMPLSEKKPESYAQRTKAVPANLTLLTLILGQLY
ncbi:hypothetical protein NW868_07145, partial [Synechococcus sp. R60.2]